MGLIFNRADQPQEDEMWSSHAWCEVRAYQGRGPENTNVDRLLLTNLQFEPRWMATSVSAQSEWSGGPLSRKYAQSDMASVLMDREAKLKTTCGIFIEENSPCRPKKKKSRENIGMQVPQLLRALLRLISILFWSICELNDKTTGQPNFASGLYIARITHHHRGCMLCVLPFVRVT